VADWRVCEQVNKQGDGAVPGLGQCGVDVREVRESESTPLITQAGHDVDGGVGRRPGRAQDVERAAADIVGGLASRCRWIHELSAAALGGGVLKASSSGGTRSTRSVLLVGSTSNDLRKITNPNSFSCLLDWTLHNHTVV
jgi:hypothetical protein